MLIHAGSLSRTLDAVAAALAGGAPPAGPESVAAGRERVPAGRELVAARREGARERVAAARWIAARQGLPGAYADSFAGFDAEMRGGIRLFTGERVASASARHILGQEACRALRQLAVRDRAVQRALDRATDGLLERLARSAADPRNTNLGVFCCGTCTVGLWRHLAVGGLDQQRERLRGGLRHLRTVRDGRGGWRRFPFWYTVLVLVEVDLPEALAELRYAAAKLRRAAARTAAEGYARRRRDLAARAVARIGQAVGPRPDDPRGRAHAGGRAGGQ